MLYEVAYYSDYIYIYVYSSKHKGYIHCGMSSLSHESATIDSGHQMKVMSCYVFYRYSQLFSRDRYS